MTYASHPDEVGKAIRQKRAREAPHEYGCECSPCQEAEAAQKRKVMESLDCRCWDLFDPHRPHDERYQPTDHCVLCGADSLTVVRDRKAFVARLKEENAVAPAPWISARLFDLRAYDAAGVQLGVSPALAEKAREILSRPLLAGGAIGETEALIVRALAAEIPEELERASNLLDTSWDQPAGDGVALNSTFHPGSLETAEIDLPESEHEKRIQLIIRQARDFADRDLAQCFGRDRMNALQTLLIIEILEAVRR